MSEIKRFCKTLLLEDDPRLIEEYKKVHAPGAVWSEITRGMKEVGIVDMEIYLLGTRLFMSNLPLDKVFKNARYRCSECGNEF
jgi:L-rhamnose mutarotase